MAVLLDFNAVVIAKTATATKDLGVANTDLLAIKNYFFRDILHLRQKFYDGGDFIICRDDKTNWRKDFFPYYKITRKETRADAPFDWDLCKEAIQSIAEDLVEFFPYKTILVKNCEADDVIGTLTKHIRGWLPEERRCAKEEWVTIGSRDQDFYSLHQIPNVLQYSPTERKYLRCLDPVEYLAHKILKGDTGDAVPNVLSSDDSIAMKIRQKPITAARIEKWESHRKSTGELHEDLDPVKYARNKKLVDLMEEIPVDIEDEIISVFENTKPTSRLKTASYFIKNGMRELHQNIQHF